jgi:hypothetical protein
MIYIKHLIKHPMLNNVRTICDDYAYFIDSTVNTSKQQQQWSDINFVHIFVSLFSNQKTVFEWGKVKKL